MKDGFKVIKCKNCKIAFIDPFLSPELIEQIYNRQEYYTHLISHDYRQAQADRFPWEKALAYIESFLKNKKRLLDIGSGTGFFLNLAKNRGWDGLGVETSKFAYNYSQEKYSIKVINKPLQEAGFACESFDLVTLWNVLEHLSDPVGMLQDVYKLTKRGGLIAFSVPNIGSLEAGLFRENWAELGPLEKGHMYYFTPQASDYILNKTGFKLKKIFSLGGIGFRSHVLKQDFDSPQKNKSMAIECIAASIRWGVGLFNKGGIIIVIAGKR